MLGCHGCDLFLEVINLLGLGLGLVVQREATVLESFEVFLQELRSCQLELQRDGRMGGRVVRLRDQRAWLDVVVPAALDELVDFVIQRSVPVIVIAVGQHGSKQVINTPGRLGDTN